jgi:hypothetical protein
LIDSTLYGNSERGLNNQFGTATLIACTVTGNSDFGLANYHSGSSGTIALTDTIVAGNSLNGSATDIGGTGPSYVTGSDNLVGTGGSGGLTVAGNNQLGITDPGLAPLGNYGGPTETIPLLPGSPAIGKGVATDYPNTINPITSDQRGEPMDSPAPDIGAFQSEGFTLTPVVGSTPQSTVIGTAFANPLAVTVTANDSLEPVAGGVVTFTAPSSGASAILSTTTATIGSDGIASVTATANFTTSAYTVTATSGALTLDFALTNTIPINFSGVTNQTITYGTSSVTLSGTLANGSQAPVSENVAVTLSGV